MKKTIFFFAFVLFFTNHLLAQKITGLELHFNSKSPKIEMYNYIELNVYLVNKSSATIKSFKYGQCEHDWIGYVQKWEGTLNGSPMKFNSFSDAPSSKFGLKKFVEIKPGDSIYAGNLQYKIEGFGNYKIVCTLSQDPAKVNMKWAENSEAVEKAKQISTFSVSSNPFEFTITESKIGTFDVKEISEAELDKKPEISNLETAFSNPSEAYKLIVGGNITNDIMSKVCLLKNLKVLSFNKISGIEAFPEELSQLNLIELSFDGCNNVKLPASLNKLSTLKKISFSNSYFTEIPAFVLQLSNLETLSIFSCSINDLPDGIENLKKLKNLYLERLKITKLNPKVSKLISLERLVLSNSLTSFPEISGCTNLKFLDLSENTELTTISPEIGKLTKLEEFRMVYCGISSIPKEISNLKKLNTLFLNSNKITTVSNDLYQCTSLQNINLSNNQISEIAAGINVLTSLGEFWASNNALKKLPEGLSKCPKLYKVVVQFNKIKDNDSEGVVLEKRLRDNYAYKLKGK